MISSRVYNTQVVFSAILGLIFFSEIPAHLSICGYVIIIGMAVFRWYWNLTHEREEEVKEGTTEEVTAETEPHP